MKTDENIKSLFKDFKTEPSSSEDFINRLQKRLDAVEVVKAYHDEQIRKERERALIFLVAGLGIGALVAAILILHPVSVTSPQMVFIPAMISFISSYKLYIITAIALCTLGYGVIAASKS